MGKNSSIQWTDHTWNIAVGCSKVDADCLFCYMYRGALNGTRYDPKKVRKTKTVFNTPLKIKEPSKIFTSSLTDFFHEDCDSFRDEAWQIIKACPQHTFQILTKRPERIGWKTLLYEKIGDGRCVAGILYANMKNVWMGTSVGHDNSSHRIRLLIEGMWHGFKFLSLEPLHGPVHLREWLSVKNKEGLPEIGWVIVGGESGNENGNYRYRPCQIEWIEDIINKCWEAGVPVFVKQLGTYLSNKLGLKDRHGGDIDEWPEHLRIRQFPNK